MNTLYDSETFSVVHLLANAQELAAAQQTAGARKEFALLAPSPLLARHGFEIVDKRSGKEVYLDGSWAELFQRQIKEWQQNTPSQQEVEAKLDEYAGLAQNPLVIH
jgi:hypothetical protein